MVERGYMNERTIEPSEIYLRICANIEKVMHGQSDAIRKMLAGFVTEGHVLLEDNPGTGKTTLAKSLAVSINSRFKRIQFTPDLLPSDILGVSVFNQNDKDFHFHEGPIFTEILLADEINRTSPRTQSALLEAMGEGQVSIDEACAPSRSFSSSSPRRTPWSRGAPIPCPMPRWTALPSGNTLPAEIRPRRGFRAGQGIAGVVGGVVDKRNYDSTGAGMGKVRLKPYLKKPSFMA